MKEVVQIEENAYMHKSVIYHPMWAKPTSGEQLNCSAKGIQVLK